MNERLKDTVPVPRRILDEHMPELSGSSLRVILAITRQTLGWRTADGGRKKREWISHRWLQKMTGCSGSSVSDAVDLLVRQALIVVTDEKGRRLHSKEMRRAHRGRTYFELAEIGHEGQPSRLPWDRKESGVGKGGRIKEKEIKVGSISAPSVAKRGWASASETLSSLARDRSRYF